MTGILEDENKGMVCLGAVVSFLLSRNDVVLCESPCLANCHREPIWMAVYSYFLIISEDRIQ